MAEDAEELPGAGGEDTGRLIAASQLEQTPVFDAQGHHLGRIVALMLDRSSGRVVYVVLSASEPGGSERLVPLPWSKLTYDAAKDRYAADIDEGTWKAAPSYGAAETPWTERDTIATYQITTTRHGMNDVLKRSRVGPEELRRVVN